MPLPLIAWAAIAAGSAAASYAGYKLVGDDDSGQSERKATQQAEREPKARDRAVERRDIQRREEALALASKQVALELKALGIQCLEPMNTTRLRRLRLDEVPPSSEVSRRIELLASLTGRDEKELGALSATLTVIEPQLSFDQGSDSLDAKVHDCRSKHHVLNMLEAIDDCLSEEIART
ncbi:hypothetical protein [Halomonas koreensis]|uniref:DUF2489 domain-containing protein n=1 Tax=Halomonas koreensis TaxID=245385 RepID=A0ABU1G5G4_9GAMM|nr:hypothetical protein [Halomonas koreensis]MDR5868161.1 hypothetical protein [Halomonas koreensis]